MKTKFYSLTFVLQLALVAHSAFAAPGVTLTTPAIAAANVDQGTTNNIVYAVQMVVSSAGAVTANNIQFTLGGTEDNTDLSSVNVYFNSAAVSISGASFLGSAIATFAAPHVYSIPISNTMAASTQGFYIIAVNVNSGATDNHTVLINGATNPAVFSFTATVTVTNNQSNKDLAKTIQAADITLTTSSIAAANINQGSTNDIVYATQMVVSATEPVTVNNIQFTLGGTEDMDDLTTVNVYFNPLGVSISGASFLGSATATFAAPQDYSISLFNTMAAGTKGFYIIAVNVSPTATDNHTVLINGATTPAVFGFTTVPNVTNSQSNKALKQTIQAGDVTLTTPSIAAANINQGSTNDIVYATQMVLGTTEAVTVNNIQFTLGGTIDNNDLTTLNIYFNPLAASISGASFLGSAIATFATPQTYSIGIFNTMAPGSKGFYIIAVNVSSGATDNHNISINGATNPAVFGFTTAPNVTNTQTNKALKQTIQGADITLTTASIAAANINQGSTNNIVYAAQMVVSTEPVTVNNIQFTLGGTEDVDDLTTVNIYFNATAATISGASFIGSANANFVAPHVYSIGIFTNMAAGSQGFYIIAVNVSSSATDNHSVQIRGDSTPAIFGFTTSPKVTNNQSNKALKQTIQAADITLTTPVIAAGNIKQGSSNHIVYAAKMVVATEPVSVNNIQFTLGGTVDNNDLTTVSVYFNASAVSISGASFIGSTNANFAAPQDYSVSIFNNMAAGSSGFYIVAVNASSTATIGKNIKVNGATDPAVFSFTTTPNVTDNQSNAAGTQTISAALERTGNPGSAGILQNRGSIVMNDLFPNPASGSFNCSLSSISIQQAAIRLIDYSGRIVMSRTISLDRGINRLSLDVSSLINGIYNLSVADNSGLIVLSKQVVIRH